MQIISWITTAICLLGTILNVKKLNDCFYLWLIGNILWLCIDIYNGLWSRAILDIVQGVLAVWGIIEWRKNK
ncbi:MAG: nicotinamide mononucleotide transporter [Acutalibacteraceae bacterium]|nr:nicotinamide mononucleotide transporter [Acutalibacteraceae bacterium]